MIYEKYIHLNYNGRTAYLFSKSENEKEIGWHIFLDSSGHRLPEETVVFEIFNESVSIVIRRPDLNRPDLNEPTFKMFDFAEKLDPLLRQNKDTVALINEWNQNNKEL